MNFTFPFCVGAPEITPLLERLSPMGSLPDETDHVYAGVPPVAASEMLYGAPFVPEGRLDVTIARFPGVTVMDAFFESVCCGEPLS